MDTVIRDLRKWIQPVEPFYDPFAKGTAVEDCRAYPRSSCSNNNFDISFESFDIWKEVREKAELEQSKFGHC